MQYKVKAFNEKISHSEPLSVGDRILDIQSEMGELAKEVLKSTDYGSQPFQVSEDFEMEFGDTLYSMMSLANETGINAEEALNKVLAKYQKRYEEKGNLGSGN